ncbi:TIM barrel protein [Actinoplanes sp. NPDC051851]|uniref:sugar phosphate isomerase/epimerase family protein n=1 Tax=Actinoplanes sp. NPDC051851 TaxID=3154753 RepID=UPI0034132B61
MTTKIKRGVSLYSLQEEFFLRKLTLEQCIAEMSRLDIRGIETIAEQMMPGYPNLPDGFYEQWHGWMKQYGTVPTAHDMFLDTKLHRDRPLSLEESVESLKVDIRHAAKLGCFVIRVLVTTPPEVVEAAAPYAIDHGITLALEIHSPWDWDDEHIQRHLEVADRVGVEHVGVMPDMGIYVRRFPRVIWQRALRDGATPAIVDQIVERYDNRDTATIVEDVERLGGNPADVNLARTSTHFICSDPKLLLDHLPAVHHIQAKFYEMTTVDGLDEEYSIPYPEIIAILKRGDWDGYLSSEYEGNRHIQDAFEVESVDQVRRQHAMFTRLLG